MTSVCILVFISQKSMPTVRYNIIILRKRTTSLRTDIAAASAQNISRMKNLTTVWSKDLQLDLRDYLYLKNCKNHSRNIFMSRGKNWGERAWRITIYVICIINYINEMVEYT